MLITIFQNLTGTLLHYLSKGSESSRPMAPGQQVPNYLCYSIITTRLTKLWKVPEATLHTREVVIHPVCLKSQGCL